MANSRHQSKIGAASRFGSSCCRWAVAVVFTILAFSFWYLQVVQNEKFSELAENNHQRTIALRAPRGVMLDRNGEVLVENRSSFTISIVREHTKDLDRTIRVLSRGRGARPEARAATSSTGIAASRPIGRS